MSVFFSGVLIGGFAVAALIWAACAFAGSIYRLLPDGTEDVHSPPERKP